MVSLRNIIVLVGVSFSMQKYCNEHMMRLSVYWKLNLLPSWTQLVLTFFFLSCSMVVILLKDMPCPLPSCFTPSPALIQGNETLSPSRGKCDRCYQNICLPQGDWQLPFPSSQNLAAMLWEAKPHMEATGKKTKALQSTAPAKDPGKSHVSQPSCTFQSLQPPSTRSGKEKSPTEPHQPVISCCC